MTEITNDLGVALPEIFMAVSALVLLLIGAFRGENSAKLVAGLAVAVCVVAMVLVDSERTIAFSGLFIRDAFAQYAKIACLGATALALILSLGYLGREHIFRFEYPVLFVIAALGMMMMVSAHDLIALYMGLELQSLALYVVASFRRDSVRSTEAGLKYFVLGAVASGMLLYGASMVYGFTGTTDFAVLASVLDQPSTSVGLIIGLVFVISGLAFKVSAVPFHMWTPDVYEGAPTPVTAFFAAAPKIAAVVLLVRLLMGPFGGLVEQWQQVVVALSLLSMIWGSFAAIAQTNIKRLMAYSAIAHVGYLLLGIAAGNTDGVRAVLIYLAIYLFLTLGTFALILCLRQNGRMIEEIPEMAGLSKSHPLLAAVLLMFMFSLAGIPPLAGFFGKYFVFLAAWDAGLKIPALIGVLSSVVGAFYYLRVIKVFYFEPARESLDRPFGRELTWVAAGATLVNGLFFLFPHPVTGSAAVAAAALLGG